MSCQFWEEGPLQTRALQANTRDLTNLISASTVEKRVTRKIPVSLKDQEIEQAGDVPFRNVQINPITGA